jgi:hypothetical protein
MIEGLLAHLIVCFALSFKEQSLKYKTWNVWQLGDPFGSSGGLGWF